MPATIREAIGDELYVSISQIKAYLLCPRQFELRYVRGVEPEFVPRALAFGIAFHAALAHHYIDLRDLHVAPTTEKLIETFRRAWALKLDGSVPVQGEDDEPKVDPLDLAAKMLGKFVENAKATEQDLVVDAVEQPFSVTLVDPDTGEVLEEKLVGAIDLVAHEGDLTIVVEHKSAAKKYGVDQLRYDLQPTAYQLAMHELGWSPIGLRYQIVTKTKSPQVQIENIVRDQQDEDDFLRVAFGVLKAIDAGVSYPVRGWQCRSCPYQTACAKKTS